MRSEARSAYALMREQGHQGWIAGMSLNIALRILGALIFVSQNEQTDAQEDAARRVMSCLRHMVGLPEVPCPRGVVFGFTRISIVRVAPGDPFYMPVAIASVVALDDPSIDDPSSPEAPGYVVGTHPGLKVKGGLADHGVTGALIEMRR